MSRNLLVTFHRKINIPLNALCTFDHHMTVLVHGSSEVPKTVYFVKIINVKVNSLDYNQEYGICVLPQVCNFYCVPYFIIFLLLVFLFKIATLSSSVPLCNVITHYLLCLNISFYQKQEHQDKIYNRKIQKNICKILIDFDETDLQKQKSRKDQHVSVFNRWFTDTRHTNVMSSFANCDV